jgi:hypothetical protein
MEEALVKRLLAMAAITDIFSTNIFWGAAPEGTPYPFLVINVAADPGDYDHDGPVKLQFTRMQFDSYSTIFADTVLGSRVVLSEMETAETVDDVVFEDAWKVSSMNMPADPLEDGTPVFRKTMDIMVPHRPAG